MTCADFPTTAGLTGDCDGNQGSKAEETQHNEDSVEDVEPLRGQLQQVSWKEKRKRTSVMGTSTSLLNPGPRTGHRARFRVTTINLHIPSNTVVLNRGVVVPELGSF